MPLVVSDVWGRRVVCVAAIIPTWITTAYVKFERVTTGAIIRCKYIALTGLCALDPCTKCNIGTGNVIHNTVNGNIIRAIQFQCAADHSFYPLGVAA